MKRMYVLNTEQSNGRRWSAANFNCDSSLEEIQSVNQNADQYNKMLQLSEEYVIIKDSCDVNVTSVDTKAALSLQASIQAAIAIIIRLSINDDETAELVTQDLLQAVKIKQLTYQKTLIENSKNVDVSITDTQVTLNIQLLIQLLIAIVASLELDLG